ncbi:alpha/beta hydrolase [Aspergillus caelatus]|uniref:Alpha/beta hydrolase n=1 Tax=Aspergillus caelatus TaxID=61420 RepID=A0A5N6ZUY5_9EURO|nr:alpha/beta hydrolase [Aspergillus caelatus]KAE8361083.1 alpha/beta hydrolase [Aspergillus caelatus]
MQPIVSENVLINGSRIAYGIYGTGQPVVLIHGTPSSSLIWRNVVPQLTTAGFKVHVFDQLGYGMSERPWDPRIDTSMTGQVPMLEGLLDHWGLETFHLVAHDIGGGIAQRFGVFNPHRLRSLTLVDVVSFDSYPSKRTREQMATGLQALCDTADDDHRSHFKEWLLSAVYDKKSFTDTSLNTFLEYISGPIGQGSLFQHQVRHYYPKHTMEIANRLHELGRMPVNLVWGADDAWQVVNWAHKLKNAIPGAELDILEDCGHFSPEDQPEKLAKTLIAFIQRHESS